MKKFIAATALLCGCLSPGLAAAQSAPAMQPLAQAQNAFAVDLYRQLDHGRDNFLVSPYSVATAVSMVFAGAKGDTAAQMEKTLHLDLLGAPAGDAGLRKTLLQDFAQQTLLPDSAPDYGPKIRTANALWVAADADVSPAYVTEIKNDFHGDIQPSDFTDEQGTMDQINNWVADQTNNKILNLIRPGMISPASRMVLTNAVYFQARWSQQFENAATDKETFHLSSGADVQTDMMNMTSNFRLTEADGVKILEIPYENGDASMVIVLPDRKDGLPALEAGLNANTLSQWLANGPYTLVKLVLPKFREASAFNLADVLKTLGMRDAFDSAKADLTDIAHYPDGRLYVSDVVHQATISVDEDGTEATAATAIITSESAGAAMSGPPPPPPVPFIADHPFIYIIRDNPTGAILFIGRMNDPTQPGS